MKEREIRIVKSNKGYLYIQEKRKRGKWKDLGRYCGFGVTMLKTFKTKKEAIKYYIEDELESNFRHVKLTVLNIELFE
jgi:hypothetical protein|tara:strand:+ start:219 stop:452 length:234 start_codon:yes stop_codon:yes gene_type:complete